MSAEAWFAVAPLLAILATALIALVVDAAASPAAALRTAAAGLGASAVLAVATATREGIVVGGIRSGGTQGVLAAVGCLIAVAALLAGDRRWRELPHAGQVASLMAFSVAGSVVLVGAFDVATFVVALEIVALTAYALVASARTARAYEAAMKYFVQGAVATGLLAYGVAILFGALGASLRFTPLVVPASPAVTSALVLLVAALAFKFGAFPFHSWAPDAYETAPPAVAAYVATFPKVAALLALPTVLLTVFERYEAQWAPLIAGLALVSIVAGNLAALRQTSFRRMLAYSGIAQVGYALVAVATGSRGYPYVILFGIFYALAAAGAFLTAEAAGEGTAWDGTIAGLAGLGRRRPWLAASLAVCLLSLTGIPLTAGFWGKLLAFATAVQGTTWLVVIAVLGSVVSFGYYGGVLRAVYLDDAPEPLPEPEEAEAPVLEEAGALAPRSVGAMAADPGRSRLAAFVVFLIALALLAGGLAPLAWGTRIFGVLMR